MKRTSVSFSFKIFIAFTGSILLMSAAFSFFFIRYETTKMEQGLVQNGKLLAEILANSSRMGVFVENRTLLEAPVQGALLYPDILQCCLFTNDGKLLISRIRSDMTVEGLSPGPGTIDAPVLEKLKSCGSVLCIESERTATFWAPVASTLSAMFSEEVFSKRPDSKLPAHKIIGFARIVVDKAPLKAGIHSLMVKSIGISLLFWLVGSGASFLISKRISIPLKRLTRAALNLKNGNPSLPVAVDSSDEIGHLATTFNCMAEALKQREKALQEANNCLENKIRERTRELEETNRSLQIKIREAEEAEKKLWESRKKYRNILESIEEGYVEIDPDGNLTFFNTPLCRILDHDPEQLATMNISDITAPDSLVKLQYAIQNVSRTRKSLFLSNHQALTSSQALVVLDLSMSPILTPGGDVTGTRIVARDISERLKAEHHRLQLEKELEQAQKLKAIGTLAGGVAHDFNNILMGIQGNISLIELDMDSTHPFYDKIRNIGHCVETAANITKRLLGFARGGKYDVRPTNLNTVIENTASMFGRTRKEIRIDEHLQPDLWPVEADRSQLEQVLLNIYINAWQAMPKGGCLSIRTENVALAGSDVKAYDAEPGRYIRCDIEDTGIGMEEEIKSRIFEPFFTTKQIGSGSGLGLASVYGIIKNHGGFITVDSTKGSGSTFHIFLPASDKSCIEPQMPKSSRVKGNGTVFIIDDEALILDTTRLMLEKLGYRVLTAGCGEEAVGIYRQQRGGIDLVILDMVMPGLSCEDTFQSLRCINPQAWILLSSGYSINEQSSRLLKSGRSGFMQKPYTLDELSQKIAQMLEQKRTDCSA